MTRISHPQPIKSALEMTGFVVFQRGSDAIWGTGGTEDEARADAVKWLGQDGEEIDQETLVVRRATAELIRSVVEDGKPEHYRVVGGVVFTPEEADGLAGGEEARRDAWRAWIAEHRDAWPLPPYFRQRGVSEAVYRRALEAMAWAFAEGKPSVRLSRANSVPMWGDAAKRREGTDGWLSAHPVGLAAEMLENLGDSAWRNELVQGPQLRLRSLGEAIYGDEWISPLARALGVDVRTAQRWASGEIVAPASVFEELAPAARQAVARLRERLARLESVIA